MGTLKKKEIKWTESTIQSYLKKYFLNPNSINYVAENLYIYNWESDLWILTKSNISYEFEIKISRNDFKNDFLHKKKKHFLLNEIYSSDINSDNKYNNTCANYFYYAVPYNLIQIDDVPEYAGLIYMIDTFPYYKIIKGAPKINNGKNNENDLKLIKKFYFNYRNLKDKQDSEKEELIEKKVLKNKEIDNKDYKKENDSLKTELKISNQIIRQLESILLENNIGFDYRMIEDYAINKIKNDNI